MVTKKAPAKKGVAGSDSKHKGRTLENETDVNVNKVIEIEKAQKLNRTIGEKISETIAAFCGSMVFVYVHVVWFAG